MSYSSSSGVDGGRVFNDRRREASRLEGSSERARRGSGERPSRLRLRLDFECRLKLTQGIR
jgi:hypothetical protein